MARSLHILNSLGVLLLALLCVSQWRANRSLQLRNLQLTQTCHHYQQQHAEQDRLIQGSRTDLDVLRLQLQTAASALRDREANLAQVRNNLVQVESELAQLKTNLNQWTQAVASRDAQLLEASRNLQSLANDRKEAVHRFNQLATNYQQVLEALDTRTRDYNALAERLKSKAGTP